MATPIENRPLASTDNTAMSGTTMCLACSGYHAHHAKSSRAVGMRRAKRKPPTDLR